MLGGRVEDLHLGVVVGGVTKDLGKPRSEPGALNHRGKDVLSLALPPQQEDLLDPAHQPLLDPLVDSPPLTDHMSIQQGHQLLVFDLVTHLHEVVPDAMHVLSFIQQIGEVVEHFVNAGERVLALDKAMVGGINQVVVVEESFY